MPRTTVISVRGILGDNYSSEALLTPFIEIANALVSRVATCATNKGTPLSATELELLERWLAAHYYCVMDPLYKSKKTGDASATFEGKSDMYLMGSRYGQAALSLDYSGCLAKVGSGELGKNTAGLEWLGKPPSDQIDYRLRR